MADSTRIGKRWLASVMLSISCVALLAGTIAPPQQSVALQSSAAVHTGMAGMMAEEGKAAKPCPQNADKERSQVARKDPAAGHRSVRDPLKVLLRGILL